MPINYRCKYNNIWDSTTRRYRNCKNKKCHDNFCTIHYKLLYNEHAIMIQKMYKGYYIRKKLKIYYNLPRDLQRKIIWHVNSDLYLRTYNSSVSKIIYRRYKEFYNKYIDIVPNLHINLHINSDIFTELYSNLISLIRLSIKYNLIINIYKIPFFYKIISLCFNIQRFLLNHNKNNTDLFIIQKYICLFT